MEGSLLSNVGKADSCTSVGNQLRARRRRCVEGCRQSGTTITTTAATFGRRCTVPDLLTSLRRQYGFASSQPSTTRIGGQGGVDSERERKRGKRTLRADAATWTAYTHEGEGRELADGRRAVYHVISRVGPPLVLCGRTVGWRVKYPPRIKRLG